MSVFRRSVLGSESSSRRFSSSSSDAGTVRIVFGEVPDCCDRTDFISSCWLGFLLHYYSPGDCRDCFNLFLVFLCSSVGNPYHPLFPGSRFGRLVLLQSLLAASLGIRPIFRVVVFFSEVFHFVSFLFFADCFPGVVLSLPGVFAMQTMASTALAIN